MVQKQMLHHQHQRLLNLTHNLPPGRIQKNLIETPWLDLLSQVFRD